MDPRKHAHFGRGWPYLVQPTQIRTLAVLDVESAESLLFERREGGRDQRNLLFFAALGQLFAQLLEHVVEGPPVGLDDAFFHPAEVPLAEVGEEGILLRILYPLLLFAM